MFAFKPNSPFLFATEYDRKLSDKTRMKIWNCETITDENTAPIHSLDDLGCGSVDLLTFNKSGSKAVTVAYTQTSDTKVNMVCLWDTSDVSSVRKINIYITNRQAEPAYKITDAYFSDNSEIVIATVDNGEFIVIDGQNGNPLVTKSIVKAIADANHAINVNIYPIISPCNNFFATFGHGTMNGNASDQILFFHNITQIWNMYDYSLIQTLKRDNMPKKACREIPKSIGFTPDRRSIVECFRDRTIDFKNGYNMRRSIVECFRDRTVNFKNGYNMVKINLFDEKSQVYLADIKNGKLPLYDVLKLYHGGVIHKQTGAMGRYEKTAQ